MSGAAPDLSVIVPSVNGMGDLRGALAALAAQRADAAIEVIVADRLGAEVRDALAREFPAVRVLSAPAGTTIPALRRMAFAAARGRVVGVIEDHVIVPPDWAARMLAAHAEGAEAVGGAVENAATGSLGDWSAFLCEYSQSLEPAAGPSDWLTGNNVTYRRATLARFQQAIDDERWENHLHDAMRAGGVTLLSRPDIVVGHKMHYGPFGYPGQRFLYSRAYAGMRVAGAPLGRRLVWGAAAFALPPVLLARIAGRIRRSPRYRAHLLRSLPLIAGYTVAWAAGEIAGYWFGPGNALGRVR